MFLCLSPAFCIKMHEINFITHTRTGSVIGIRIFISFQPIIFRMELLPVYDVKHSKYVTTFLQQRKQLDTPKTCLLFLTSNKTMGHMTPFMVHLPVMDKKNYTSISKDG